MFFSSFFVFVHDRALLSYYCFCSYIGRERYSSTKSPLHFSLTWNYIKFVDSFFLSLSFGSGVVLTQFSLFFYFCFVQYTFRLCVSLYKKFCVRASLFLLLFVCWLYLVGVLAPFEWKSTFWFWLCINFIGKRVEINWLHESVKAFFRKLECIFFLSSFANKLTIDCCKSNNFFSFQKVNIISMLSISEVEKEKASCLRRKKTQ